MTIASTSLSPSLYRKLAMYCDKHRRTKSDVLAALLDKHIDAMLEEEVTGEVSMTRTHQLTPKRGRPKAQPVQLTGIAADIHFYNTKWKELKSAQLKASREYYRIEKASNEPLTQITNAEVAAARAAALKAQQDLAEFRERMDRFAKANNLTLQFK